MNSFFYFQIWEPGRNLLLNYILAKHINTQEKSAKNVKSGWLNFSSKPYIYKNFKKRKQKISNTKNKPE